MNGALHETGVFAENIGHGGGGMIMQPSTFRDFDNPEIAEVIEATQQSPRSNAHDKVKFYKLAWDAVGSEFGSRHVQYEMFYAGAPFVTKGHMYRNYDFAGANDLVQRALDGYDAGGRLPVTTYC